jgi:hypothetical protein
MLKRWKKRISPFLIAILTFTMSSAVDVQNLSVYADELQAAEAWFTVEEDSALEDTANEENPDEENPEVTKEEPGEVAELGEVADVEPPEAGAEENPEEVPAEALGAALEEPDRVGSGTASSPYEIFTEADLIALANGEFDNNFSAFYILKNDIALTAARVDAHRRQCAGILLGDV